MPLLFIPVVQHKNISWLITLAVSSSSNGMDDLNGMDDTMKDPVIARELRDVVLPQLTNQTYEACWRFVTELLPWEQNFMDKFSTQFFFIRLVFTTLSPLIFRLISKEEDTPQGAKLKQDLNMRNWHS